MNSLERLPTKRKEELLLFYNKYCIKNDLSKSRTLKLITLLKSTQDKTGKLLSEITEDDIDEMNFNSIMDYIK